MAVDARAFFARHTKKHGHTAEDFETFLMHNEGYGQSRKYLQKLHLRMQRRAAKAAGRHI